jgi:hypothetical protein
VLGFALTGASDCTLASRSETKPGGREAGKGRSEGVTGMGKLKNEEGERVNDLIFLP